MNHHLLLILHLVAAATWVGGHLVLLVAIVPTALRLNTSQLILDFERKFEKLGMTALLVLVATGITMALQFGVSASRWFHFADPIERVVSLKLSLLLATVAFALSAQLRAIPRLKSGQSTLKPMVFHIAGVTLLGTAMLILGSFVRYGGL